MLEVCTDVIFSEDRGVSSCLGEEDISNVMVIAF